MVAAATSHPLLCDTCSCALIFAGAAAMAVGRCAACVKRLAVAARPSIFKDSCRTGSGLVANGVTVATRGLCSCGGRLYTKREAAEGRCVDCDIEAQREAAAELQREHDAACEPVEAGIEPSAASCGGGR